jgi:16S rRNA (cytidine1402-2'-O)-methyltransferase
LTLYITPVPIGNLKDITVRAIEILKKVDFIIVEDTKYSLKLLNHLEIKKPLMSYYKPKERVKAKAIIERLKKENAAIITDSGTPIISDPGYFLVNEAIREGVCIESLPGPTAFVPALTLSGIESDRFTFIGFTPKKKGELKNLLKEYSERAETLIFYESPRRVDNFLNLAREVFGNRRFAIIKELTKKNEEVIRGYLKDFDKLLSDIKLLGEFVIVIEGNKLGTDSSLKLETVDDIYNFFKTEHNIPKNKIKDIFMKRKG